MTQNECKKSHRLTLTGKKENIVNSHELSPVPLDAPLDYSLGKFTLKVQF